MIFDFIINFVSYGESGVFPWKTRYVIKNLITKKHFFVIKFHFIYVMEISVILFGWDFGFWLRFWILVVILWSWVVESTVFGPCTLIFWVLYSFFGFGVQYPKKSMGIVLQVLIKNGFWALYSTFSCYKNIKYVFITRNIRKYTNNWLCWSASWTE
jgi:hypothetical protein